MEYRRLGHSGLKVSTICLGTWLTFGGRLDDRAASAIVHKALDLGICFIDTADVYELGAAEAALGRALEGVSRKDYVLASKCYFPTGPGPNDRGLSRKHIDESLHASLDRLRTSYLDLFQCHRFDEETPLEETVRAMDDAIRQGKILYWGVSCWTAPRIQAAVETAHAMGAPPPISNQPPYSLLERGVEESVLAACRAHGLGVLAYSPLAQGVLSGKYLDGGRPEGSRLADEKRNRFMDQYLDEPSVARVREFARLAAEMGATPAQLALAWLLKREAVASVVVGATRVAQVEENAAAAALEPDDELMARLDELFAT